MKPREEDWEEMQTLARDLRADAELIQALLDGRQLENSNFTVSDLLEAVQEYVDDLEEQLRDLALEQCVCGHTQVGHSYSGDDRRCMSIDDGKHCDCKVWRPVPDDKPSATEGGAS